MTAQGTIRASEARAVVRNLIESRRVSKAAYGFRDGKFVFLVGEREVSVHVPPGATFYGLRDTLARIERIIDEMEAAKLRRSQLDLEVAIAQAAE